MIGGMNKVILVGTLSSKGVEVKYLDSGAAVASFALELHELGQNGQVYKQLVFCEVFGKRAEAASAIPPGTLYAFEGKLRRRKQGEGWDTTVQGFELTPLSRVGVPAVAGRN